MKNLCTILVTVFCICSVAFAGAEKKRVTRNLDLFSASRIETSLEAASPSSTLFESFESTTFPPAGWAELAPRGGGGGWSRELVGTKPVPGWDGNSITAPPVTGANTAVAFITYDTVKAFNDFWLVSSKITNAQPTDTISFWLRKMSISYADTLDVKIFVSSYANVATALNLATIGFAHNQDSLGWTKFSYKLGTIVPAGSDIYIAFREKVADNVNDGGAFFLDLVSYTSSAVVPVELSAFSAKAANGKVNLSWSTATETNNKGFEVQRKSNDGSYITLAFIEGKGTTAKKQDYSFTDANAASGKNIYRLKQIDFDGTTTLSKTVEADVKLSAPSTFTLDQNYPNPFNPSTSIKFSLAADSKVVLKVYNILGQPVSTLINGNVAAGVHSVNFNASSLTSGVYMYKLEAKGIDGSSFMNTKKMILTR